MKKAFIVLGMLAGAIAGFGLTFLIISLINLANPESPTQETEVIEATEVREHEINLNDYDTNIALVEEGEYQLSGDFSHLIKIDVPTDKETEIKPQVTLRLNNVNITSDIGAIKNTYYNDLIINSPAKTTNTIKATSDKVVDATGHLAIDGDGVLTIQNQQTTGRGIAVSALSAGIYGSEVVLIGSTSDSGAGISTEDCYWIKGGDVTILGNDMLEAPVSNDARFLDLTPRSASFSLKQRYPADSTIKVLNSKGARVATYTAPSEFRTVVVSNNLIAPGEYTLYINNTEVKTVEVK